MLDEEEIEKARRAGRIGSEVRRWAEGYVKENMKILDVCEAVEKEIKRKGGELAFPCNIDVNDVAAHYTSPPGDEARIPPSSIVKIDLGVHIDGYISDTAATVCFNYEYMALKQATDEALEAALKLVQAGARVSEIGATVQGVIERYGLKPVRNLMGHGLGRYQIHIPGRSIPSVKTLAGYRLEEGELYAIEPFATTKEGEGQITGGKDAYIFRVVKAKLPKDRDERRLMEAIRSNFLSLPFSLRGAAELSETENFQAVFKRLVKARYIAGYEVLVEAGQQPVSQTEHTVLVKRGGCEVTTL